MPSVVSVVNEVMERTPPRGWAVILLFRAQESSVILVSYTFGSVPALHPRGPKHHTAPGGAAPGSLVDYGGGTLTAPSGHGSRGSDLCLSRW